MAAEHSAYDKYPQDAPTGLSRYRDYQSSPVNGLSSETLATIKERVTALRSDLRGTYETVTQLDIRITGHQVPPTASETSAPKVVRDGFIDSVNEILSDIQGLTSGIDARLRNLTEKVGS